MKKDFVILVCILLILLFTGCEQTGETSSADEYSITILSDYPIENNMKQSYRAGEKVTIKLPTVTEQYYRLLVNGEEQKQSSNDTEYTYFIFSMPSENSTIEIIEVSVDIPADPSLE